MRPSILLLIVVGVLLSGCGGGSQSAAIEGTPHATFQITWPDRSRVPIATSLSSALSATVTFKASSVDGADVATMVNRDPTKPSAHVETYTLGQTLYPHGNSVTVKFFADSGGTGALVGTAASTFTLTAGQVEVASFTLVGIVKSLSVLVPNPIKVGDPAVQLQASTLDANGVVVAVTPGTYTWKIVSGNASLSLTPDGLATALAGGTASVQVTADGLASPSQALLLKPALKKFIVTDIGSAGGLQTFGENINNSGQVSGMTFINGAWNGFLYTNGQFVIFDTDPLTSTDVWGMNDQGDLTGPLNSSVSHAYIYSKGVLTDLGTFGGRTAAGDKINNLGWIGGTSDQGPFVYKNGQVTFLRGPSNETIQGMVGGINDSGIVCGSAILGGTGIYHSFIYKNGQMTDLGTFGGQSSNAVDMNQAGHIVGGSQLTTGTYHGFLYDGTTMMDIGTLKDSKGSYSSATAINSYDQIVGLGIDSQGKGKPCLWSNGEVIDLTTVVDDMHGFTFMNALDINDKGQILILAYKQDVDNSTRAIILNPTN